MFEQPRLESMLPFWQYNTFATAQCQNDSMPRTQGCCLKNKLKMLESPFSYFCTCSILTFLLTLQIKLYSRATKGTNMVMKYNIFKIVFAYVRNLTNRFVTSKNCTFQLGIILRCKTGKKWSRLFLSFLRRFLLYNQHFDFVCLIYDDTAKLYSISHLKKYKNIAKVCVEEDLTEEFTGESSGGRIHQREEFDQWMFTREDFPITLKVFNFAGT